MVDVTERVLEVETGFGKEPVDLQRAKEAYADLIAGKTHPAPCRCPSCLYHLHKSKGGRFDKEAFFLDWLSSEVKLSLVNKKDWILFETAWGRGRNASGWELEDLVRARGTVRGLADFVDKNFLDIDPSPQRIKLKLWRFRKSGVIAALEKEISLNWIKANPVKEAWDRRLAQRVADYIYKRRGHAATQRDLRRFFQKPVEELEDLRPWLRLFYRIGWKLGSRKNQIIYFGTRRTSRRRFLSVGSSH